MGTSNIEKIREILNKCDDGKSSDLCEKIEKLIESEKKKINRCKKPESKIAHYEIICASVLSAISQMKEVL